MPFGLPDSTATPTDGMVSPGSDPPPATASVSTTFAFGTAAAIVSARLRSSSTVAVAMRHTGIDVASPERYVSATSCNAASVILSARIARASGWRGDRADDVGPADDHTGLRAAQQLVAREGDDRRAVVDGLAYAGFVVQPGGALRQPRRRVVEEPGTGVDHDRRPEGRELGNGRRLGEPDHPVVRRVHLQDQRRVAAQLSLVVGPARPVGRPDLDEPATRLGHDLGHAETAADLDQLTARDDHLATAGQSRQRQQDGSGVVVDDQPGLGTARAREQCARVVVARAAASGLEPVFEVRVSGRDLGRGCEGAARDGSASQVRVDDHAGRVHDRAQPGRADAIDPIARVVEHLVEARGLAGLDPDAGGRDGRTRAVDHQGVGEPVRNRVERRDHPLDRGKRASRVGHGSSVGSTSARGRGRRPQGAHLQ